MEQQEARALLGIIGLGACCDSCANGGSCEGVGLAPRDATRQTQTSARAPHSQGPTKQGDRPPVYHAATTSEASVELPKPFPMPDQPMPSWRHPAGFAQALAERGQTHMGPVWPVGTPQRGERYEIAVPPYVPARAMRAGFSQMTAEMPAIHPLMSRQFMRLLGLGMDYTPNPTPGDYHVKGNGVILRALPNYNSKEIATLQNGENVYVFGDVETDPAWKILEDESVVPNPGDWAGIDYVHVGTQTHGAGWIAMVYIEPGAGTKFGQQKPQPSSSPSPAPSSSGMGLVSKVLLGGAIVATVAGGVLLIGKAVSESRHLAHA